MGLFGGGDSTTTVKNDNRNFAMNAGNASLLIGAGATATGIDPSVVADYTGAAQQITASGTDAVKTLAQFGQQELANMGGNVTDILSLAANNATTSWEHTLNTSSDILKAQTQTASTLAQQAVLATNSQQGTNDTLIKIVGFVVVGFVAFALLRGKAKA